MGELVGDPWDIDQILGGFCALPAPEQYEVRKYMPHMIGSQVLKGGTKKECDDFYKKLSDDEKLYCNVVPKDELD